MSEKSSWIEVPDHSDFPLENLPFGVGKRLNGTVSVYTRVGDMAIDLGAMVACDLLADPRFSGRDLFQTDSLNAFMGSGSTVWSAVRYRLTELLTAGNPEFRDAEDNKHKCLVPVSELTMQIPSHIGDYTDFYSSIEHATNMGKMFRDPENALLPNWKHIPVGYNGRASSIVVSGTPIRRPLGQTKADDADAPSFGPSKLFDIELEMGFFTGPGNTLGEPIPIDKAHEHIFGMAIVNDWSARDIQKWEYVPLGPFLGKSFGTSVSPWVVTLEALEPFRVQGQAQDPPVLPYLQTSRPGAYDLELEILLKTPKMSEGHRICRTNFASMYWSMSQQLTHQTSNGTNIRPGDLYASGTVSGSTEDSFGSLLELTWRGTKPLQLPSGEERKFLLDGDEVIMRAWGEKDGLRVGLDEVRGVVEPAGD